MNKPMQEPSDFIELKAIFHSGRTIDSFCHQELTAILTLCAKLKPRLKNTAQYPGRV
jgi:hypothetical protein